ncbi:MAG: hypothetical protein IJD67_00400 [Clostridia bacterium]|nr:hypothetical protein [Clostridia bacterium]
MRKIILGTDWGLDCDDVVAVRILARAHKQGRIKLCGVVINHFLENSVASLDGFLESEGIHALPLGIDRSITSGEGKYQAHLAKRAVSYSSNDDAEDGIRLYRRLLAESDGKVEIAEIGFLQALAGLIQSKPDDISDKSGVELMREKVDKLWIMAGKWDDEIGKEYNFNYNPITRAAASVVCALAPVPITFLGFEIGVDVISGSKLDADDVLYIAMVDHGSVNGRSSWDPMLALLAVNGSEEDSGYSIVHGRASADAKSGDNTFVRDENGPHAYVVRKFAPEYYADAIDGFIK